MSDLLEILLVSMIAAFVSAVIFLVGPHREGILTEPQKIPFLGGSAPQTHAWQRYHVRYYSMTLLFIAFEMEMMFMYPWAVVYVEEGATALVEMGMFLVILSVGIVYGWREGIFRWQ